WAAAMTRSPGAVATTGVLRRSNSTTPSSSSALATWALRVGCDTWQAAAARPKWPVRWTATMYWSCVRLGMDARCSTQARRSPRGGHAPQAARPVQVEAVRVHDHVPRLHEGLVELRLVVRVDLGDG